MKLHQSVAAVCLLFVSNVLSEDVTLSLHNDLKLILKDRGVSGTDFYLVQGDESQLTVTKSINLPSEYKKIDRKNGVTTIEWPGENKISIRSVEANFVTVTSIEHNFASEIVITSCYPLRSETGTQWYGGPQQKKQYWPIQKGNFTEYAYLSKELDNAGVSERYWLSSDGVAVYFDLRAPLFISQNDEKSGNNICFRSEVKSPYRTDRETYSFTETIVLGGNAKSVHEFAVKEFLKKPTGIPDRRMVQYPIWSTWARYSRPINETVVLELANEILSNDFPNSQFEIDDLWEICYGSLTFDTKKFPDIKGLVEQLHSMGFRVTLWIHPFINKDCDPWYSDALSKGYLVQDANGSTVTSWWNNNGTTATYVDFTKPEVRKWFSNRLSLLLNETGIDSYKFDAGESSWTPPNPILTGPKDLHPHLITQDYVREVAQFGPLIEVRSGQNTQDLPIFIRMIDKDSTWTWNNGLPTLVTTLLQMNMVGYTLVLPDMIGGNGYDDTPPTKELFIRWLQANVFMPSLQYSFVPWDFDTETIEICRRFTQLHADYTDAIVQQFQRSVDLGEPVNPPVWWLDPSDTAAQKIYDEFLLGDLILAAPVIEENQTSRSVYLPKGRWLDPNDGDKIIEGPQLLLDYPAPLDVLPYFINTNSVLYTSKDN